MNVQVNENYPAKKLKLLEASLQLMIAKGYHATTVDEICAEAKVTKGSFFHYFKNKEEAAKATLEHFEKYQSMKIRDAAIDHFNDPWLKLHAYINFFVKLANEADTPKSCLTAIITHELADLNADFRELCGEKFLSNAKPLKDILDEVILHYPPAKSIDSQKLADYFLSLYQGSLILAKAKRNYTILEENIEHFRTYIITLFNKELPLNK